MTGTPSPEFPGDPLGFAHLRERWRRAPELEPALPTSDQVESLAASLVADFERFLGEPGAAHAISEEAARRLELLVRWTTARHRWIP